MEKSLSSIRNYSYHKLLSMAFMPRLRGVIDNS